MDNNGCNDLVMILWCWNNVAYGRHLRCKVWCFNISSGADIYSYNTYYFFCCEFVYSIHACDGYTCTQTLTFSPFNVCTNALVAKPCFHTLPSSCPLSVSHLLVLVAPLPTLAFAWLPCLKLLCGCPFVYLVFIPNNYSNSHQVGILNVGSNFCPNMCRTPRLCPS